METLYSPIIIGELPRRLACHLVFIMIRAIRIGKAGGGVGIIITSFITITCLFLRQANYFLPAPPVKPGDATLDLLVFKIICAFLLPRLIIFAARQCSFVRKLSTPTKATTGKYLCFLLFQKFLRALLQRN